MTNKIIAFAGNPNVGKSTLFNRLTGMNQHTGNWSGKTVETASGIYKGKKKTYELIDLPGTYSLLSNSPEEEIAGDFLSFSKPDGVVVVCDCTLLERNLNLILQIIETGNPVIVCVNMLDEAKKKHIEIDLEKLSSLLGVPVIGSSAKSKKGIKEIKKAIEEEIFTSPSFSPVTYCNEIEESLSFLVKIISKYTNALLARRIALRILKSDDNFINKAKEYYSFFCDTDFEEALWQSRAALYRNGINSNLLEDKIAFSIVKKAEEIARLCLKTRKETYSQKEEKADKILTGKISSFPIMIIFLALIFWLTIVGANYPSRVLSLLFGKIGVFLEGLFISIKMPSFITSLIMDGAFKVLSYVVSVMLPPMAIFFPLFSLLEDSGILPRIAFNLDYPFSKGNSCGKQALTMCMGLGCNAVGVSASRIIENKNQRILSILTNCFVPCNGRFPTMITLITIFFTLGKGNMSSFICALFLTAVILTGILFTFLFTKLLSVTLLKGNSPSFVMELPPYRMPDIKKVLVRSLFDRTLKVLLRAVAVSIPAGIILFLMSNIYIEDTSLIILCSNFLEPIGNIMGLDGAIILAFILGSAANEIVLPIIIMIYISSSVLSDGYTVTQIGEILKSNGFTSVSALCTIIFSLFHWPCTTTLLTIKKETGSLKWTLLSVIIPTVLGIILCVTINLLSKGIGNI